jgi:tRNA threonylcarbamoyladenosine biosynthesis protein TsaE
MKAFGARLIESCQSAGIITLKGELGTGKTTIVRGALEARGITSGVRSPTYTLVEYYDLSGLAVAHFDLYRLGDPEELEYLGYRDYVQSDTLCFIEWPERAQGYLEQVDLQLTIEYRDGCRELRSTPKSGWGEGLSSRLNLT